MFFLGNLHKYGVQNHQSPARFKITSHFCIACQVIFARTKYMRDNFGLMQNQPIPENYCCYNSKHKVRLENLHIRLVWSAEIVELPLFEKRWDLTGSIGRTTFDWLSMILNSSFSTIDDWNRTHNQWGLLRRLLFVMPEKSVCNQALYLEQWNDPVSHFL